MKKFFKNNLKTILAVSATAVICISGTVFAAFQYNAKQVEYKDGKSVEQALNELYNKNKVPFIWRNDGNFSTGTIDCDVAKYSKAIIFCEYDGTNEYTGMTSSKVIDINIGETIYMTGYNTNKQLSYSKPIKFNTNSIEIQTGTYTGVVNGSGCGFVDGIILY